MKKSIFLGLMILSVSLGSVAQKKQIIVESDKALDNGFSKYKTFAFASMIDTDLEVGFYFLNDLVLKSQIREAVPNCPFNWTICKRDFQKLNISDCNEFGMG